MHYGCVFCCLLASVPAAASATIKHLYSPATDGDFMADLAMAYRTIYVRWPGKVSREIRRSNMTQADNRKSINIMNGRGTAY